MKRVKLLVDIEVANAEDPKELADELRFLVDEAFAHKLDEAAEEGDGTVGATTVAVVP